MPELLQLATDSEHRTQLVAARLASCCRQGDCILLEGDLGSGKTAFARGFIQALCGNEECVTSPTFTIMQEYRTQQGMALYHFDLYRIEKQSELENIGINETIGSAITLIEWPAIAREYLPDTALTVAIAQDGEMKRTFVFRGLPEWKARLERMT